MNTIYAHLLPKADLAVANGPTAWTLFACLLVGQPREVLIDAPISRRGQGSELMDTLSSPRTHSLNVIHPLIIRSHKTIFQIG